jgi:hypothetical protein
VFLHCTNKGLKILEILHNVRYVGVFVLVCSVKTDKGMNGLNTTKQKNPRISTEAAGRSSFVGSQALPLLYPRVRGGLGQKWVKVSR